MKIGTNALLLVIATCTLLAPHASSSEPPSVATLMAKALSAAQGKEVVVLSVEYGPGGADPIHRHFGQAFVYVLEGSIEMQVKGGPLVKLEPGQTFYEGPDDVHVVGRNASRTKPARFLAVLVKDQGAPVLVPE